MGWIAAGVVAWLLIAVPVAVCVGRILGVEDRTRVHPVDLNGGWLIHHCRGYDQNIEYTEPEKLPDVKRIHNTWCGHRQRVAPTRQPERQQPGNATGTGHHHR